MGHPGLNWWNAKMTQQKLPFIQTLLFNLEFTVPYDGPRAKYRDIPIRFLKQVQDQLRGTAKPGYRLTYRFRGPRFDKMRAFTRKEHANRFAVYEVPRRRVQP
jgi:hypothetical protein